MSDWTDAIVGERMAVDREFNDRVQASEFSSQEWGLIMTATEFEIEHPDDSEKAKLVANTEKVPSIMPELDNIQDQMAAMGGGAGGGSGGSGSGGLLGGIKRALGLGAGEEGVDEERLEAAEQLTQEYAEELQAQLEANGRWEQVRVAYQE